MSQGLQSTFEKVMSRTDIKTDTPFQHKLYTILEAEEYKDIISWNLDGLKFEIKSPESLAEKVLPLFYNHKKFSSFVRQLNYYGFKCTKEIGGARFYAHPFFQRGNKSLLTKMYRNKPSARSKGKNNDDLPAEKPCSWEYETNQLSQELQVATRRLQQLTEENQYLRREIQKFGLFDFPYEGYEMSKRVFGEGFSQPSMIDHAPFLEGALPFTSYERAIQGSYDKAMIDPKDFAPYLYQRYPTLNDVDVDHAKNISALQ